MDITSYLKSLSPDHIFRGTSPELFSSAYSNTPKYCYTYEESKRFCLENQGSLVTIEDPVKYEKTLEFARSFIRASKKLQRTKFWTDMWFCNSTCGNVSIYLRSCTNKIKVVGSSPTGSDI